MESSSSQYFNDQPSTSKSASSPQEFCRLRRQLNSDCLVKIFEYLNVRDLIQLCKMDTYFYDLINSQIIAKKLIDLGEMDKRLPNNRLVLKHSTIESFKMFGKSMRKIVIRGEDFCLFLNTIIEYCEPDRFLEIDLQFKLSSEFDASVLIGRSLPFFTKLRRLKLFDVSSNGLYQLFLTKIAECVKSVEVLQLQQVDIVDGWLQKMQNLSKLWIHKSTTISIEDVSSCCKANPNLKAFEYKGYTNMLDIYHALSEHCPRLQTFSDFHLSNLDYRSEADVAGRYSFLSQFKQLQHLTLTSYTESGHDLSHHLKIPTLTKISKFRAYMNWDRPIVLRKERKQEIIQRSFTTFDDLKTVEIEILNIGDINCDLRCEYIFQLISKLKNIENMKFVGRSLTNVNSALRHASNIRRLCIAETHFRMTHQPNELLNIVRAARRVPIRHPLEEKKKKYLLHLNVNEHQWNDLKMYEHSRPVMTTSVQSFS